MFRLAQDHHKFYLNWTFLDLQGHYNSEQGYAGGRGFVGDHQERYGSGSVANLNVSAVNDDQRSVFFYHFIFWKLILSHCQIPLVIDN